MSYFDGGGYGRRRNLLWLAVVVIAVVSGIVGGMLGVALGPSFRGSNPPGATTPGIPASPLPPVDISTSGVSSIADRVGPAVVGITNYQGRDFFGNTDVASGSGVIFDAANGYVVTNNHVVAGAVRLSVRIDQNREYEGKILGADPDSDLAVVKIEAPDIAALRLPQVQFGDSDKVKVGDLVVAIGNPLGEQFARSVTMGVISALNREITVQTSANREVTLRVLQTDAAINPGNSGGALVNAQGQVIGINSAKISVPGVEGMGFAIPINDARPIIQQLLQKGRVSRPFLGIYNYQEISEQASKWFGYPVGIYVGGVFPGGPAMKAGMREGDVIVQIDDRPIRTSSDLRNALRGHKVGDVVKVIVVRNNNRLELSVTLGEMPSQ
ncbi:MAG: trypsin-like peptidase domain-containing protein [Clostridia bacterium]|nr:trypsin-like peptidase domain-containing protein [Clostridia bacterium]